VYSSVQTGILTVVSMQARISHVLCPRGASGCRSGSREGDEVPRIAMRRVASDVRSDFRSVAQPVRPSMTDELNRRQALKWIGGPLIGGSMLTVAAGCGGGDGGRRGRHRVRRRGPQPRGPAPGERHALGGPRPGENPSPAPHARPAGNSRRTTPESLSSTRPAGINTAGTAASTCPIRTEMGSGRASACRARSTRVTGAFSTRSTPEKAWCRVRRPDGISRTAQEHKIGREAARWDLSALVARISHDP